MPRDGSRTRQRVLDAAIVEFAGRGLAGARIARIAEDSGANPSSIYQFFTSKEQLFDEAVTEALAEIGRAVPVTPNDLPGFAVRSLDWTLAHPAVLRLHMWRMLEAPTSGPDDRTLYAEAVERMAAAADATGPIPPADLLIMVLGMVLNWVFSSPDLLSADGRDPASPERIADYRTSLRKAVELLGPRER